MRVLAWILLAVGLVIFIYFIYGAKADGYGVFHNTKIDYPLTGQFGDFVGGVVGTLFSLAGTILIYMTFVEQSNQNKREDFESKFFEMVRLHGENVNQLQYTTYINPKKKSTAQNRKVFREIFSEFDECYGEVNKFFNGIDKENCLTQPHFTRLESIIAQNKLNVTPIDLAFLDIVYSIIYYGVGSEGYRVLLQKFEKKYNISLYGPLLVYLRLKPKRENDTQWNSWKEIIALTPNEIREIIQEIYDLEARFGRDSLSDRVKTFFPETSFYKYYGGHQHRLGHYFRHLFQCYKYISNHTGLTALDKYFYGKTLRAQLSTYEQAILCINSVSHLGMRWDYLADHVIVNGKKTSQYLKLITTYNLIRNVPGDHLFRHKYKDLYPFVNFDFDE